MFANKIRITQDYIDLIVKKRKEHSLTAYELSEMLGKNKSWIPNIENHRTKNLSKDNLFMIFKNFAKEENLEPEQYIIKYLHPNALIPLENGSEVKCFTLQTELNLSDLSFYKSDIDRLIAPSGKNDLQFQLNHFVEIMLDKYNASNLDLQSFSDIIDTMESNIFFNFSLTMELYKLNLYKYCPLDEDNSFVYERNKELKQILTDTKEKIELNNAKTKVYSFFSNPNSSLFSKLDDDFDRIYDDVDTDELSYALSNIEEYSDSILEYITLAYEYSLSCQVDFVKIYKIAQQYLYAFITKAKISENVKLDIPHATEITKDKINALHLQLITLIKKLKKKTNEKYHIEI